MHTPKKASKWFWYVFIVLFCIEILSYVIALNLGDKVTTLNSFLSSLTFAGAFGLPGVFAVLSVFIIIFLLAKKFEWKTILPPAFSILIGVDFLLSVVFRFGIPTVMQMSILAFIGLCITLFFAFKE